MSEAHSTPGAFLQAASDEASFLELFRSWCTKTLPRNKRLRDQIIQNIYASSGEAAALNPFDWYERDTIIPPIPMLWLERTSEPLQNGRVTHKKIDNVCDQSLHQLISGEMINDEIVEKYLELIRVGTGAVIGTTRLLGKARLGRLERGIDHQRLLDCGQLFIPIHHESLSHWTFVRLHLENGSLLVIEHYDSLYISMSRLRNEKEFQVLTTWLADAFKGLPSKIFPGPSPRQMNLVDCGLFMLLGIRTMALGSQHLSQKQADKYMPSFRARVLAGILCGDLDPSSAAYDSFLLDEGATTPYVSPAASSYVKYTGSGLKDEPLCIDTPESTGGTGALQRSLHSPKATLGIGTPQSSSQEHEEQGSFDEGLEGTTPILDHASAQQVKPEQIIKPEQVTKLGQKVGGNCESTSLKTTPTSQNRKHTRQSEVEYHVKNFADRQSIVAMLRGAVVVLRSKEPVVSSKTPLPVPWPTEKQKEDLLGQYLAIGVDDGLHNKLIQRSRRELFSRNFYGHVHSFGPRMNKMIRAHMKILLRCEKEKDSIMYDAAYCQASKSSIWTELVDCFTPSLGSKSAVALCGASETTTYYEGLSKIDRNVFIQGIKDRILDPQDCILQTLRFASELYYVVSRTELPKHSMLIEGQVDMSCMTFQALVHVRKAPLQLPLPSRPISA